METVPPAPLPKKTSHRVASVLYDLSLQHQSLFVQAVYPLSIPPIIQPGLHTESLLRRLGCRGSRRPLGYLISGPRLCPP